MNASPEDRAARLLEVLVELRTFTSKVRREWRVRVPDVTLAESVVLLAVRRHEMVTAGDIAHELGIDKSTASRHIVALENRGLLQREGIEGERRAQSLIITQAGLDILTEMDRVRLDTIAERLEGWSDDDVAAFESLLRRFNQA
jgi:DNA-binding MarR family transcriptional regulator